MNLLFILNIHNQILNVRFYKKHKKTKECFIIILDWSANPNFKPESLLQEIKKNIHFYVNVACKMIMMLLLIIIDIIS